MNELSMEDIEKRSLEIEEELKGGSADVDALEQEVAELEERKAEIMRQTEQRKKEIEAVERTAHEIKSFESNEGGKTMEAKEIRNSKEYLDAYANYIRTGNPAECRALLTTNATDGGMVAVPELVYDVVKTAWEREGITARIKKSYLKGNLKVAFEMSSSEAIVHAEGEEVQEENLQLGIIELIPQAIKKWISISDEALDMDSEAYLRYIYDELTYRIAKAVAKDFVDLVVGASDTTTAEEIGIPVIELAPAVGTVARALAQLSDSATNPVVIMNKATWGNFKQAQYSAQYPVDPFEGLEVLFTSALPSYDTATDDAIYMIVGDLENGALMNFPNGDEITIKRDDYTFATKDLVRFIGREYVAYGVVAPGHFVNVKK